MTIASSYKRFIPLLNRVLIKKAEPITKSKVGIIMSTKGENVNIGQVVSVGKGTVTEGGKIIPVEIELGSTVLLPEFGGQKVNLEDGEYFLYRDNEVLGVLEN